MKLILENKIFQLEKELSKSDDSILLKFGDNDIELFKSKNPIFLRTGEIKNLDIKINGFEKILNKLSISDDYIKMTFH